jgi:DNA helicase-2/ATP-dependent DNA helicase PcrA
MHGSLTDEQQAVITAPTDRHIKVPAVAGAGKSTTLRYRIEYLLDNGVAPEQLMVFMFNKSAQQTFEADLRQLDLPSYPQVKTFDAQGLSLCHELMAKGWLADAELNTSTREYHHLCREALQQAVGPQPPHDCNPYNQSVLDAFSGFVSLVKTHLIGPLAMFKQHHYEHTLAPFIKGFEHFEQLRASRKVRFFADLIYDAVQCIAHNEAAKAFVSNRFTHILIDEYQDINAISQQLIKLLAGERAKVTVVGDDDQTLYQFRGADPLFLITHFDKDFPDPLVFPLTTTFRFGHAIALIANNVISNNPQRMDKLSYSSATAPATDVLLYAQAQTKGQTPPTQVITAIQHWIADGGNYQDIAILLRVFAFSPLIELLLIAQGIPYRLEGHPSVLGAQAVNSLMSVLQLSCPSANRSMDKRVNDVLQVLRYPTPMVSVNNLTKLAHCILTTPAAIETTILTLCPKHPRSATARLT